MYRLNVHATLIESLKMYQEFLVFETFESKIVDHMYMNCLCMLPKHICFTGLRGS